MQNEVRFLNSMDCWFSVLQGPQGYLHACIWLAQLLRTDGSSKAHIVM